MKERIIELFIMLPRDEQLELLRELNSSLSEENPVKKLNELSQTIYRENIKFEIENIGDQLCPIIKADLTTPWGIYSATGSNQRIAKTKVAELALAAANELNESKK